MFHGLLDVHASSPSPGGRAKVDVPNSVSDLNQTPTVEWYVVRCGSLERYQKDMCLKETGLHAQNMITILGSIVNIIGWTSMIIQ